MRNHGFMWLALSMMTLHPPGWRAATVGRKTAANQSVKRKPLVVPATGKVHGNTPCESMAATKLLRSPASALVKPNMVAGTPICDLCGSGARGGQRALSG